MEKGGFNNLVRETMAGKLLKITTRLYVRDELTSLPVAIGKVLSNDPAMPEAEAYTKLLTDILPKQMIAELKARVVPPLKQFFGFTNPQLVDTIEPQFDNASYCEVSFEPYTDAELAEFEANFNKEKNED